MNLKNSLKQLADPFYLWKKSKLDCVSAWGAGRHHWPGQDEQDRPQKIFCGVFWVMRAWQEAGLALLVRWCCLSCPAEHAAAQSTYHRGLNSYLLCLNANQERSLFAQN